MSTVKIDWLSFTLPIGEGRRIPPHRLAKAVARAIEEFSPVVYDMLFGGFDFEQRTGRPPYSMGFARSDNGVFCFAGSNLPHLLVEVTGRGCDALSGYVSADQFLRAIAPRLTRLDIAVDMLCDTSPLEFVAKREEGRFKAHSEVVSQSGTTCYVGSKTSERYARVYRYNPPHERSHLLRAEHVIKAENAKITAQAILDSGLEAVAVSLGDAFGWQHHDWHVGDITPAELATWRPERREGKTLYWLNAQVAPVLKRLHEAGTLDVTKWLHDNVLSDNIPFEPPAP